jgi:hypothetical protein
LGRLNPDKLFVEYRDGIGPAWPIIPRLYTLTHSDITAELFLTVGYKHAYDKITSMRDEVLAEWVPYGADHVALLASVYVDSEKGLEASAFRNTIFVRELPLALEAIRYGDRQLFDAFPYLDDAPVFIRFTSKYPQFNRLERWGNISDYRVR